MFVCFSKVLAGLFVLNLFISDDGDALSEAMLLCIVAGDGRIGLFTLATGLALSCEDVACGEFCTADVTCFTLARAAAIWEFDTGDPCSPGTLRGVSNGERLAVGVEVRDGEAWTLPPGVAMRVGVCVDKLGKAFAKAISANHGKETKQS